MIVPCIDLMGGEVVQLVQGKERALARPLAETLQAFEGFPLIHVIDLDAAMGQGENSALVSEILRKRRARVGGGVRTVERAIALLEAGGHQVIVGSRAFRDEGIDFEFLAHLAAAVGTHKIVVAIDTKQGQVAVQGWKKLLPVTPADVIGQLDPFCGGFLCTFVDKEGLLQGTDLDLFLNLRSRTDKTLIAAGGITTMAEVKALTSAGIEAALGMAVYTGTLELEVLRALAHSL